MFNNFSNQVQNLPIHIQIERLDKQLATINSTIINNLPSPDAVTRINQILLSYNQLMQSLSLANTHDLNLIYPMEIRRTQYLHCASNLNQLKQFLENEITLLELLREPKGNSLHYKTANAKIKELTQATAANQPAPPPLPTFFPQTNASTQTTTPNVARALF